MLGRVHAMNEKEEQALAAFEAGRDALQAGQGGENKAGEMLTVSWRKAMYPTSCPHFMILLCYSDRLIMGTSACQSIYEC